MERFPGESDQATVLGQAIDRFRHGVMDNDVLAGVVMSATTDGAFATDHKPDDRPGFNILPNLLGKRLSDGEMVSAMSLRLVSTTTLVAEGSASRHDVAIKDIPVFGMRTYRGSSEYSPDTEFLDAVLERKTEEQPPSEQELIDVVAAAEATRRLVLELGDECAQQGVQVVFSSKTGEVGYRSRP
ncbi:hypothetical protein CR970_02685 [Candidatus Saccharibacteria bacterium]|nr:MAG: hypothetical protein CR970_02685 [Candidatus Saccharibacteria bacterium]